MTRTRLLAATAIGAVAIFGWAGPAGAQAEPAITVEPSTDLSDGDTVTVMATGFPANGTGFQSTQCVAPASDPLSQCDLSNVVTVTLDENGEATFEFTVHTGAIGTGLCDAESEPCLVVLGSLTAPEGAAQPITFAAVELAATGPNSTLLLVAAGVGLIVVGFLTIAVPGWMKRRGTVDVADVR